MELIYKQESYQIIGACFEVYNELGNGFDEAVYHEALALEFSERKILFSSEPVVNVHYKKQVLKKTFKPDMVVGSKIIIELKAVKQLNDLHRQQVMNYLKATKFKLGLLVNFGQDRELEYERIVM